MNDNSTGRWIKDGLIRRWQPGIADIDLTMQPATCEDCPKRLSNPTSRRCRGCHLAAVSNQKPSPTRRPAVRYFDWTEESLKRAHAGHWRGDRDAWTLEGEREYNRRRKLAQAARKAVA